MDDWFFVEIEGYPSYEVCRAGLVRNKKRGTYVKPSITPNGYLTIGLYRNGVRDKPTLGFIVAQAFVAPFRGRQVNYKDGNKHNNHASNLKWVAHKIRVEA